MGGNVPAPLPNPIPATELQLRGVHDDGTNEGVIRAKIAQGDLVKIGADAIQCQVQAPDTSSAVFQVQNNQYNSDGSNQAVIMTCSAGSNQGVVVSRKFYGKVIGERFQRNSTTPAVDLVVDGVASAVPSPALQFDGAIPSSTPQDGEAYYLIADDLPDGEHTVSVVLTPDPAIATPQTLALYGFLAERRAGYVDRTRANDMVSNGQVPTTAVGIARTTLKNIRKIDYVNTTAAPITVTVYYSAVTTGNMAWTKSIAAGDTQSFDPGDLTTFSGSHVAGAVGVNFFAYGRN